MTDAIRYVRSEQESRRSEGYLPWVKAHDGIGADWFNESQIEAIARTLEARGII